MSRSSTLAGLGEKELAALRSRSVLVATPMFGGMCHRAYHLSCLSLLAESAAAGLKLGFISLENESLVPRARNVLARDFMASDFESLLFIDADIIFRTRDVFDLLLADRDIACASYPMKAIGWDNIGKAAQLGAKAHELADFGGISVVELADRSASTTSLDMTKPVEVRRCGTGFMLIRRRVLDSFRKTYPRLSYTASQGEMFAFFNTEIKELPDGKREYLSEDYFFCDQARLLGFAIHLLPWISLGHRGSYTFRSDFGKMAALSSGADWNA